MFMYLTHVRNTQNDSEQDIFNGTNLYMLNSSYNRFNTLELSSDDLTIAQNGNFLELNNYIVALTKKMRDWLDNNKSLIQYKIFRIPKMTGGFREIKAPEDQLKAFMREIKENLNNIGILPHDSAYAYISNRDCKKAMQCHQSNESNWFLKMDVEKFFDNCSEEVIRSQFRKLYPFRLMSSESYEEFIRALCDLSCYRNELPQGTPLSPLLTNWIMISIDTEINKALAERDGQDFVYTRYADDLLISSKHPFRKDELVQMVKDVLEQEGTPFILKESKTRYGSKSGKNWNLGIMYNKDNNLTVGHKRKRRIKTMMFQFYQGNQDKQYALELNGELAYLQNIEPEYYNYLMNFMNQKYRYDFKGAIKRAIKRP